MLARSAAIVERRYDGLTDVMAWSFYDRCSFPFHLAHVCVVAIL
jgi:hypothetical protein